MTTSVALFCDVPGLWWASTRFRGCRVDYAKLRCQVGAGREIHSAVAYLAERAGLDRFLAALRISGYGTDVVPRGNHIDMLISRAALELAERAQPSSAQVDVIAIAASSGRYAELGQKLKAMGKELEIWAFPVPCVLEQEMFDKADRWNQLGEQVLLAS